MKIFGLPDHLPAPAPDYSKYDSVMMDAAETNHTNELKKYMVAIGYTGKHTGSIYRAQVADGYAQYMLADGPRGGLVHLPYGDAYQCRDVQHLPKRVIIERIEADKRMAALFA